MCHIALMKTEYINPSVFLACNNIMEKDCFIFVKKVIMTTLSIQAKMNIFMHIKNKSDRIVNLFSRLICSFNDTQLTECIKYTNGEIIKYIQVQSIKNCDYAIEMSENGSIIEFVKNKTEKQIKIAIEKYKLYLDKNGYKFQIPYMEELINAAYAE